MEEQYCVRCVLYDVSEEINMKRKRSLKWLWMGVIISATIFIAVTTLAIAISNEFGKRGSYETTERPGEMHIGVDVPWENGGKQPDEYTWAEFEAMSSEQKELFFEWFASVEEFNAWQEQAQENDRINGTPWQNGGKQPNEYTWAEFIVLSAEHQELFFEWFDSAEEFIAWQKKAQNGVGAVGVPWENGGKQPNEYTWEEFEALSAEYQEVFFEWFDSPEAFAAWQEQAQREGGAVGVPWENGGKQPNEYTWEEFEALSAEYQEMFFEWFDSPDDFQEWMNQVKP